MTLPANEIEETLAKVANQWDKTEKLLKLAESISEGPIIPSVFELRYAGRRLVDLMRAVLSQDIDKSKTYVLEVEQFCFRAQHDAVDGIIGALNNRLRFMEQQFGVDLLFNYFRNYPNTNAKLDKLAKVVAESRGHRGTRTDLYDSIQENDLPELIDRINELDKCEKALIKLAEDKKKEEDQRQKSELTAVNSLQWTVFGVIVATIFSAISLLVSVFK